MSDTILQVYPAILREPRVQALLNLLEQTAAPALQRLPLAQQTQEIVHQTLDSALNSLNGTKIPAETRQILLDAAQANLTGYGPLTWVLREAEISEVMVNGPRLVFVERNGELLETDLQFESQEQLLRIIDRILLPLGRRVDYDNPTADARLPDGSRVNVAVPPVAVDGPVITVRKFSSTRLTMDDLLAFGTLTSYMATFLKACVAARLNILVCGNTSSGKSTMLNVLSSLIPERERIITIEDAVELQLSQRHVVRMETKLAGVDGKGAVSIRDLVHNALRMRPDRIVVGEVRGGETLDMLQAMNTGHSGSLTTVHANSPRDAVARLETMALMSGLEMPVIALRRQIVAAINLIVNMSRLPDGNRKVIRITEVAGMEGDIVTLTDIYKFNQQSVSADGKVHGDLRPTGIRPLFNPRLEAAGFKLGGEFFGLGF